MADSVSNSLLIMAIGIYIGWREKWIGSIVLGIILGYLPLLRSNYMILSIGILGLTMVDGLITKKLVKNLLTSTVFFSVVVCYNIFFLYPRLETTRISSFGGILIFSRIAHYFSCDELLLKANFNVEFENGIKKICNSENVSEPYWVMLWNQKGLIIGVEKEINAIRTVSNKYFGELSKRLILYRPISVVSEMFISLVEPLKADTFFYRKNYYPSLGGGCEILPKMIGLSNSNFLEQADKSFDDIKVVIFAFFTMLFQKLLYLSGIVMASLGLYNIFKFSKLKRYGRSLEILLVLVIWVVYIFSSLFLAGFDYRYLQPLLILFVFQIYLMYKK